MSQQILVTNRLAYHFVSRKIKMNMVRIRHIMDLRRACRAPPLLPLKLKKEGCYGQERTYSGSKDILDFHLSLRHIRSDCGTSNTIICLFYTSEGGRNGPWKLITVSEKIPKASGIDITDAFSIEFTFEKPQLIRLELCDWFVNGIVPLGAAHFITSEIVSGRSRFWSVVNDETRIVICQMGVTFTKKPKSEPILVQFEGKNISKKALPDGAMTYFIVFRIEDNEERTELYKSEVVKHGTCIIWKQFVLQSTAISDFNKRQLEVSCFYREEKGNNRVVGKFLTSYIELRENIRGQKLFLLTNPLYKGGRKTCGVFEMIKCSNLAIFSFLDYLQFGITINFSFAIDFSEGDEPLDRNLRMKFAENVEFIVRALGDSTAGYMRSNSYLAFGFGARIPPQYRESHEFCLNLETDPSCLGVDGVVSAFRSTYQKIQPLSSAHFAHVIYYVSKLAQNALTQHSTFKAQYYILAIITRGAIHDIKETVQAAIFATKTPLSIVFIGTDDRNLTEVERLAIGGKRLSYQGRKSDRDNLKFVNLPYVLSGSENSSLEETMIVLSEKSLHQIPWQMSTFMMRNGVIPTRKERCSSADPSRQRKFQSRSDSLKEGILYEDFDVLRFNSFDQSLNEDLDLRSSLSHNAKPDYNRREAQSSRSFQPSDLNLELCSVRNCDERSIEADNIYCRDSNVLTGYGSHS